MDAREFLTVARDTSQRATEAYWRTAASRAYYAVMLVIRDAFLRWGLSKPSPTIVHQSVRQRLYTSRDPDMKTIGRLLDRLRDLRLIADYETTAAPSFATNAEAIVTVQRAEKVLSLFDAIDSHVGRRKAILAEIQRVFP